MDLEPKLVVLLLGVLEGFVMTAVSKPLIRRRTKRNIWYGFRVPKTLASDEVWYPANAYAGKELYIAGRVIIAASFMMLLLVPLAPTSIIVGAVTGVTFVALTRALVRSFVYLRKL